MAFDEDPTVFLDDFGVPVTAGAISGMGILDKPSEYINEGRAITDEYGLHVEAAKFRNLNYDDPITVAGEPYTVRERPMLLDDGTFCLVLLTKPDDVASLIYANTVIRATTIIAAAS